MIFVWILIAYLLGSVPFGFLTARAVAGIDIREHGSRNVGATNVFRVVGKKWGVIVLALDALKGFLAVFLSAWTASGIIPVEYRILFGITAILGHSFPVWLAFRGGKGVATSLGVFLALTPQAAGWTLLVFAAVFGISRILSLGSLAAAWAFPAVIYWQYAGTAAILWFLPVSVVLAVFITVTHRANIGRLIRGEEKRLI